MNSGLIHKTAVVDAGAQLGAGVEIGPYACIEAGAVIGDGCRIGPHACVYGSTTLGPGCRVHASAVLGDVPQDTAYETCTSFVRIGRDCVIREGVTIHRGTKPDTATTVGDGCLLMAFSHLAHNVRLGRGVILANGVLLAGYVSVDDGAFLSGNAMVHQFCRVGTLAMMGGGSGVSVDLPPFCTTAPVTMNRLLGLNVVGMRRAGLAQEERTAVRRAYRALFQEGRRPADAMARLRADHPAPAVETLCRFVEQSSRGICRP